MKRQQDKDLMRSIPSRITAEVQRPWDGNMLGMLKGEKMATTTGAKLVREEVRRDSSHDLTFSNFISDEMGSFWNEVVLQNVQSSHSWGWREWGCLREVYGACTEVPNWKRACHVHVPQLHETTKWDWGHSVNWGKESGFEIWTFIWNAMELKWLYKWGRNDKMIYAWFVFEKKIAQAVMWEKAERKKAKGKIRTC